MRLVPGQAPRRLTADCAGSTPVEYALLAGLVAVALVGALSLLGEAVSGALASVQAAFG